jgi:hypothetical protein
MAKGQVFAGQAPMTPATSVRRSLVLRHHVHSHAPDERAALRGADARGERQRAWRSILAHCGWKAERGPVLAGVRCVLKVSPHLLLAIAQPHTRQIGTELYVGCANGELLRYALEEHPTTKV